jgi:hypothetical protein
LERSIARCKIYALVAVRLPEIRGRARRRDDPAAQWEWILLRRHVWSGAGGPAAIRSQEAAMNREARAAWDGALAGAIATIPMSAVMYAAEVAGLMGEYPPEIIAEQGLAAVGVREGEDVNDAAATVAHLGFGAAAGALFGLLRRRVRLPISPVAQGIGYGLLVYAASYDGWIPAIHIMPAPENDRPGRQPSMAAAHVVYGAVLAALLRSPDVRRARG